MIFRQLARILVVFALAIALEAAEPPRSDTQIEALIRTKLAKSVIGKDGFTFRVKDGVVYWDGSTNIPQHKGGATRMAKSSGAKRVVNQIRVAGAKTPAVGQAKPASAPKAVASGESPAVSNPAPAASPKRATVQWVPAR